MTQQTDTKFINNSAEVDNKNNLTAGPVVPTGQSSSTSYVTQTESPLPSKTNLPAFLNKLHGMVNSPDTDPWVHWNDNGDSFIIPNSQALAGQILGRHFKHNNFASFVRQLNMYGFHKVPHLNHGVLLNDGLPEVWEFTNANFLRDQPGRMRYIVRKKGEAEKARMTAKKLSSSSPLASPQPHLSHLGDISVARAEIQSVANRQNIIREEMMRLAGRTESLWKYALETRNRYQEQQDKIDKIIKFLSEAFRKRHANPELRNKVRGLLEGPSAFDELSDHTSVAEQNQLDVMKMFANGKVPVGLQELIQQHLQNMGQVNNVLPPQTPASPTPSTSLFSSDALMMYQVNNNAQQLAQIQEWINQADQNVTALDGDLNNANGHYSDYLNETNFNFDSFSL